MTKILFITIFYTLTNSCFSQNQNEIRTYYGVIESKLLRNEDLLGSPNYDNENAYEIGIRYLREISNKFYVETGINFFQTEIKITPSMSLGPDANFTSRYKDLNMVSIPIYANYTFGNYFFINGGPIVDLQISKKSFDSQSGIGYSIGFGGKYNFGNLIIYLNPNYKRHSFIPFEKENDHQKLSEFGIQVGIGYEI